MICAHMCMKLLIMILCMFNNWVIIVILIQNIYSFIYIFCRTYVQFCWEKVVSVSLLTSSFLTSLSTLLFFKCFVCSRGNPPYPFTFPPSTLSCSIFYFFSLSYSLHLFSCSSIPSNCIRIVPLHFRAGCHRRRLNLALVFVCVDFVLYVFLV